MKNFQHPTELLAHVGQAIAVSDWLSITQAHINGFADATGDQQWIHVNPEKAAAGPFGCTVAHGFLTLALLPQFFATALHIEGIRMAVNYGLNRVRFPAPVPVGSRLRGHLKLLECTPLAVLDTTASTSIGMHAGGLQMAWEITTEREGSSKPVCIAESLVRYYF